MIIPAQGLRIVLAVRPVDFRCGHDALGLLCMRPAHMGVGSFYPRAGRRCPKDG